MTNISLCNALAGLVEAVRRDSDEGGKGISGYTSARLSDARAALSSAPAGGTGEPVAWLYEMALKIKPSDDQPFTNWKQMVTTTPPPTLPEGGVRNIVPLFASLPKTDPEPGKAQEDLFKAATRMRNILTSDGDPPTLNYPEGVEPDEFAEAFEALAAALQQSPGTDAAREVVFLVEIDAGTDNACWVIGNRVDQGSVPFFRGFDFPRPDREVPGSQISSHQRSQET